MHPIDLQELVRDTMSQHPTATRDELEAALINGVETRTGRILSEHDRGRVGYEVAVAWNQRNEIARLRDTLDLGPEWKVQRTPWPGGDVAGIPRFNAENRAAYDAVAGKLS